MSLQCLGVLETMLDSHPAHAIERRVRHDRRQQGLRALLVGSFRPRRRRVRRQEPARVSALDWHPAKWFAVAVLTLLLSFADSLLTLMLLDRGAVEVNPLMGFLIQRDARTFALIKLALTSFSLTALIVTSRSRAFGGVPAGLVLYATLLIYSCLIGYELWLLNLWELLW